MWYTLTIYINPIIHCLHFIGNTFVYVKMRDFFEVAELGSTLCIWQLLYKSCISIYVQHWYKTQHNSNLNLLFVGNGVFRLYRLSCFVICWRRRSVKPCWLSSWWQLRHCNKTKGWVTGNTEVMSCSGRYWLLGLTDLRQDAASDTTFRPQFVDRKLIREWKKIVTYVT